MTNQKESFSDKTKSQIVLKFNYLKFLFKQNEKLPRNVVKGKEVNTSLYVDIYVYCKSDDKYVNLIKLLPLLCCATSACCGCSFG